MKDQQEVMTLWRVIAQHTRDPQPSSPSGNGGLISCSPTSPNKSWLITSLHPSILPFPTFSPYRKWGEDLETEVPGDGVQERA